MRRAARSARRRAPPGAGSPGGGAGVGGGGGGGTAKSHRGGREGAPPRTGFKRGDAVAGPQNQVGQIFASDGTRLRVLSFQNRLFKHLGYDTVAYLEDAPEYTAQTEQVGELAGQA